MCSEYVCCAGIRRWALRLELVADRDAAKHRLDEVTL
jgi:hypothetical protein